MEWWWIAAALVVVFLLVVVLLPLSIEFNVTGRGEPSGLWALAAGVQVGPLQLSGVAARGVLPRAQADLFGRRVWSRELSDDADEPEEEEDPALTRVRRSAQSASQRYQQLSRWFDTGDLAGFAFEEKRRLQVIRCDIDVSYSFVDIMTTGRLLAALYALSGVMPAPIVIRPLPSWDAVDRMSLVAEGKIKVWPGLMLVDATWFVIRHMKLRRQPTAAADEVST